jgi:hypothetical protein
MTRAQLKEAIVVASNDNSPLSRRPTGITNAADQCSGFLISPSRSEVYQINLSKTVAEGQNENAQGRASEEQYVYDINVTCLREGDLLPVSTSFKHSSLPSIPYPSLESINFSIDGNGSLAIGTIELDLCQNDDEMEAEMIELEATVFQRVLKSFARRSQPLARQSHSEVIKWNETSPNTGFAIFGDRISSDDVSQPFLVNGARTSQEDIHIFQFSRLYQKRLGESNHQEARQYEVYMCAFDSNQDEITWMMHTITGGDISQSLSAVPETVWALHPVLPLLVWQLPGHRLRISNIDSHEPSLTISGKSAILMIDQRRYSQLSRVRHVGDRGNIGCQVFTKWSLRSYPRSRNVQKRLYEFPS